MRGFLLVAAVMVGCACGCARSSHAPLDEEGGKPAADASPRASAQGSDKWVLQGISTSCLDQISLGGGRATAKAGYTFLAVTGVLVCKGDPSFSCSRVFLMGPEGPAVRAKKRELLGFGIAGDGDSATSYYPPTGFAQGSLAITSADGRTFAVQADSVENPFSVTLPENLARVSFIFLIPESVKTEEHLLQFEDASIAVPRWDGGK